MARSISLDIEIPLRRLRRGVRRWRAQRRLSGNLVRLSDRELDGLLARAGRARGELFSDFSDNAAHRRLMGHMMARFGLDLAALVRRRWRELRRAEGLCVQCANKGRCRRWLEWGRDNPAPTVFCANFPLFAQLRLALAGPEGASDGASGGSGAAVGSGSPERSGRERPGGRGANTFS